MDHSPDTTTPRDQLRKINIAIEDLFRTRQMLSSGRQAYTGKQTLTMKLLDIDETLREWMQEREEIRQRYLSDEEARRRSTRIRFSDDSEA